MTGAGGRAGGAVAWTLREGGRLQPRGHSAPDPTRPAPQGRPPAPDPRESVSAARAPGLCGVFRGTRCPLTWALGPWPPPSCCTLLAGRASGHFWRTGHVASARSWSGSIRHATGQNVTEHGAAQPRPRARGQTDRPLWPLRGQTLTGDEEERVSPRLLAYLGVVVGPRRGVGGARVGRELHDGHAGVVDGGVGEPRAVRRPPVRDVRLQNLL